MAPIVQSYCLIWCRLVRSRDFSAPVWTVTCCWIEEAPAIKSISSWTHLCDAVHCTRNCCKNEWTHREIQREKERERATWIRQQRNTRCNDCSFAPAEAEHIVSLYTTRYVRQLVQTIFVFRSSATALKCKRVTFFLNLKSDVKNLGILVHWSRPMGGVLLLLDMSATTVSVHRFTILLWYLRNVLPSTENGSIPSLLTTGSLCRKSRRLWPYTLNTLRVMTVPTERNWSRHTVVEKWITASACTLCSSNLVSCTFYRITNRSKKRNLFATNNNAIKQEKQRTNTEFSA